MTLPKPSLAWPAAIFAAAVLISLALIMSQTREIRTSERYLEYDTREHMLTNFDGYYFLRIAEQLGGEERFESLPLPHKIPLLSRLTNALHSLTGIEHQTLAFYMPPVAATLSLLIFLIWALSIGGPVAGSVTMLFLATSPFWLVRTSLGVYDTDFLIPFFLYGVALCLYKFTVILNPRRFPWLAGALVLGAIAVLWWRPSLFVCAALAAMYPLTLFMRTSTVERLVKAGCLVGFAVLALLVLLPKGRMLLPDMVQDQFNYFYGHLQLLLKNRAAGSFADSGSFIQELQGQSLWDMARRTHAVPYFLYLSFAALIYMAWKRTVSFIYLLPFLALGLLSLQNFRFSLLFAPASALALGVAADDLFAQLTERFRSSRKTLGLVALGLGVVLAVFLIRGAAQVRFEPGMNRLHDFLAQRARSHTTPQTLAWSWWDYGYFWQYAAGRRTFFDGGSQSPLNMFIVGHSLGSSDPQQARNWIRFFAARGPRALYDVQSRLGSMDRAIGFLGEAFARPENLDEILASYNSRHFRDARAYLFPEAEVCLILPLDLMENSRVWYYYGKPEFYLGRNAERQRLFTTWPSASVFMDPNGVLRTPRGGYPIARRMTYADASSMAESSVSPEGTFLLLESDRLPTTWVAHPLLADTVAFRLLFPGLDEPMDAYFEKIDNVIGVGGVWRVK